MRTHQWQGSTRCHFGLAGLRFQNQDPGTSSLQQRCRVCSSSRGIEHPQLTYPASPSPGTRLDKGSLDLRASQGPHTNGVVESLVGVTKRALVHALAGARLTDQVFRTALSFAEQIVNLRPLAALSDSPRDYTPLTPGLFTGQLYGIRPLPVSSRLSHTDFVLFWKEAECLQLKFAKRFFTELVPELTKRDKWWSILPKIKVDQIVVVLNCPPSPQGLWPLGRVLEVNEGKDGIIRGARVLSQGKEYYRHMRHLVPLI